MKPFVALLVAGGLAAIGASAGAQTPPGDRRGEERGEGRHNAAPPIGPPGQAARYLHEPETGLPGSVVKTFTLAWGAIERREGRDYQWIHLDATKAAGQGFRLWLLSAGYPSETLAVARQTTARYLLQEGTATVTEFRDRLSGEAVLPAAGGWRDLMPRPWAGDGDLTPEGVFPAATRYLGHDYRRVTVAPGMPVAVPLAARVIELLPEVMIGLASNTRQKDETRRYDDSDYELVKLTQSDYREMLAAGINCVRVDAGQLPWVEGLNAFYWGIGLGDLPFPECLYRSAYLGPALFLDEPAVGTRDHAIRPRLGKDEAFRKALTPELVFAAFREHFRKVWQDGVPTLLRKELAARADVDLGTMDLQPPNLFSWETMVASAAYQLSQDPLIPAAMVFEPPGRVGTLRTLPELNMTYGCQLPVDCPENLTGVLYGFLRGAARLTDKEWGTSIYGSVDRSDAFWFLTHAYDLGATRFFFWDNYRLACVPYGECLALARNLRAHAESHPQRDLRRLRRAAEVAVLLPPGYNLGHVHLGKGSLWGLGELNLERSNRAGVKYRRVMGNFFTEIERCLRLGVGFDLLWDLPGIQLSGYREWVRVREDGKVEVERDGRRSVLAGARVPDRPPGSPPQLDVRLSASRGKAPLDITAQASVRETSAPVYYTFGADTGGVYHNALVAWELYGPREEDYRFLLPPRLQPQVSTRGIVAEVVVSFRIDRPGNYRLRAATVDLAGRHTIRWIPIVATE